MSSKLPYVQALSSKRSEQTVGKGAPSPLHREVEFHPVHVGQRPSVHTPLALALNDSDFRTQPYHDGSPRPCKLTFSQWQLSYEMAVFKLAALLSAFVAAAQANPVAVPRAALDLFVPPIIKPDATTVWTVGQNETVIWDTSNAPAIISNGAAVCLSGFGVIARGFDLRAGSVVVQVPAQVVPGPYNITLFGDSGNISPAFSIVSV
ncbi:unnamed protein product [Cyclocybe aegerita]|uniref:Uncharacterized protein n=1 Tax=Cyclocybe aegerita TaxID=1973307 RepID=A0A8S0XR46_CYCAE|nr:unnamed protein product [Cyclocybe aegerita]